MPTFSATGTSPDAASKVMAFMAFSAYMVFAVFVSVTAASSEATAATADSTRHAWAPLPVLFYTPETRWAGGAALMHSYRAHGQDRPTLSSGELIFTQNDQVIANIDTDVYTGDYRFSIDLGHEKFPNRFFGIGNEADLDERYTSRSTTLGVGVERRIGSSFYLGGSYALSRVELTEVEEGGALAGGTVRGGDGGVLSGLGIGVTYDTRDDIVATRRGGYARLRVERYDHALGSDYAFTRLDVDARHFTPTRASQLLALRGVARMTTEGAPFQSLGQLGGATLLRGFPAGRFRDRQLLAAQLEYRVALGWRLGAAGFASAGQVARAPSDFSAADFHLAGGAGLHFVVDREANLNLRVDFGFARGSSGVYVQVGQVF